MKAVSLAVASFTNFMMLILWLKVEVVLGEWPRRKRRRREPELFEDDFHGVLKGHAEDVGGLRKGDGRGIGVDGGHLVLDAGAGHDELAAFLAAEFRVETDFLALAAFPEPFGRRRCACSIQNLRWRPAWCRWAGRGNGRQARR